MADTTAGLGRRLGHRPAALSGGEQQRVAAARALLGHSDLVVADEPTGNLDSRASAELLGMLRQTVRELGRTIVMVTHDPSRPVTLTGSCSWPTGAWPASWASRPPRGSWRRCSATGWRGSCLIGCTSSER